MNKRLLTTQSDIKKLREYLYHEQGEIDALTGFFLESDKMVLDHCHDSQEVRFVIERQCNAALGKIENLYKRFIKPYYDMSLDDFLIRASLYLNKVPDYPAYHPKWVDKCMTEFNKLKETQKRKVMLTFRITDQCKNATERKKVFKKFLKSRAVTYGEVMQELQEVNT